MARQGDQSTDEERQQGGRDPFAEQLKSRYLERRRADLKALPKALQGKDFAAIRLAGHNMYGSGSAYGFDAVTSIGQRLESAAIARNEQEVGLLIAELENFIIRQGGRRP